MRKNVCIAVLALLSLWLLWREHYFKRIEERFSPREIKIEKLYRYTDNPSYSDQASLYEDYHTQANVVMLGNSLVFRVHWNELLERNDVVDRGINSDITAGYIKRMDAVLNCHPKICFIEGGSNDLEHRVSIRQIVSNFSLIIDTLKSRDIIPVLFAAGYVRKTFWRMYAYNRRVFLLNRQLQALAEARKIKLIDLNPELAPEKIPLPKYIQSDGVHNTGAAYLIWKKHIQEVLSYYKI